MGSMTLQKDDTELSKSILTSEAKSFINKLHRNFNPRRLALLNKRKEKQFFLDQGADPELLAETAHIRNDPSWQVASIPHDLKRRSVEITGPTDRKMLINALNSGANVFMADFEDANSPTWKNMIEGQQNLKDAIRRTLEFTSPEGKHYSLNKEVAVLMVRPRGWHLDEKHYLVDDIPISASLFDFGLFFFHNAKTLIQNGSGPYFYLPKLENHHEAKLWNDVFIFAQKELNIPVGTIRATVLLETILAAFEMEEILYELREHSAGLNAGRWDYLFSIIKKFKKRPYFLFPDRSQLTMAVPFMQAYSQLLVKTCHSRGAQAIGGMAAFIPSRKDEQANAIAFAKVKEDKAREASQGFNGTWVAHPDLVSIAKEYFEDKSEIKPEPNHSIAISQLIDFDIPEGKITEDGMRKNISIALRYLTAWLSGVGAVGIFNLMEDAATAEIARAQLWQWIHYKIAKLDNGIFITPDLYEHFAKEEAKYIREEMIKNHQDTANLDKACKLLDDLVLHENFPEFLTLQAYGLLEN